MKTLMRTKVFLRNRQTGQCYVGPNGLGWNGASAHDFGTVENAVELARTQKFTDMEVVLHYDAPARDLVLPVRHRIPQS